MSMISVQPDAAGMTMTPPPRKRVLPGWAIFLIGVVAVVGVLAMTSYLTGQPALTSSATMQNTVTLGLPILLCGLGGLWAERSGMINIGLEGMMIIGTWGAAFGGYHWGPWVAVISGMIFGALGGALHAVATVSFGVNHIVSGVAINLLGAGLTKYLSTLIFEPLSDNPRDSPPIERFDTFSAPGLSDWLGSLEQEQRVIISDVAGLVRGLVTKVSPMLIISILLVLVTYYVLWRTRFGLRLRSCGENPVAAESLGVNVYFYKYTAVIASGALAGIAGAALVLGSSPSIYQEGQTANRGFIGLAAMIFGNWRPGGTLAGCRAVRVRGRPAAGVDPGDRARAAVRGGDHSRPAGGVAAVPSQVDDRDAGGDRRGRGVRAVLRDRRAAAGVPAVHAAHHHAGGVGTGRATTTAASGGRYAL